jgi:PBP1b-binding outer membrane lipoprotein LpoB
MKGKLAAALATLVLTGCSAAALTETPGQVVSAASQAMSQLHSAKFDMTATILEQFPPAFVQQLGPAGAALGNLSVDMSGNGQAKFPDQASMSMQVKTGGLSVTTELVFAGGKLYVKDPQSGRFIQPQGADALSQFTNQADPLSSAAILKTAQSVKDLGDTTLNGTAVHHYQIVPDKNKVADQASSQQAKDLVRSMLQNGSLQIEVWIGKDDHLLHRLKDDTDATIDLNQVMQASGQQLPPGTALPSGATVHTVVHAIIDYHDFNTPVTVSVPAVSPS